jgi:prolipoprotein diacylglyceryl transferase
MFPILQLGPFAVQLPGLFLLAGIWIGTWIVDKETPRHRLSASHLSNLIFIGLVIGILGARLAYALRFLDVYLDDPLSLIALNPSTLAPIEGILSGLLAAIIYGQRKDLPLWSTLDALTPSLAVFTLAYAFSHLSSGDAFGAATTVPWAIELWDESRHPTQIYEIIISFLVLITIWRVRSRSPFSGFLFLSWVSLAAASRLFIEAYRGDSVVIFNSLRSAQVVSLGIIAVALSGLHLLARRSASTAQS